MEKLEDIIFYNLEKAIKSYRQFAQKNTVNAGIGITIDQWLLLKTLNENPIITQQQLAKQVFKDVASVTRMIDLLIRKKYIHRTIHNEDRRRFHLTITELGEKTLNQTTPISKENRKQALTGISKADIITVEKVIQKIISNTN